MTKIFNEKEKVTEEDEKEMSSTSSTDGEKTEKEIEQLKEAKIKSEIERLREALSRGNEGETEEVRKRENARHREEINLEKGKKAKKAKIFAPISTSKRQDDFEDLFSVLCGKFRESNSHKYSMAVETYENFSNENVKNGNCEKFTLKGEIPTIPFGRETWISFCNKAGDIVKYRINHSHEVLEVDARACKCEFIAPPIKNEKSYSCSLFNNSKKQKIFDGDNFQISKCGFVEGIQESGRNTMKNMQDFTSYFTR